jgi:ribonuclease T1
MKKSIAGLVSGFLFASWFGCLSMDSASARGPSDEIGVISANELPAEARQTLSRIQAGGPFPYAKDGVVFSNRERRLPRQSRGYYHEFTVKTPGARDRGARRIISGRPAEYYYTDDHYRSFRRIQERS